MTNVYSYDPVRDRRHLDFVRSLPCLTCGRKTRGDAAHLSVGNNKGIAFKAGDDKTIPHCRRCHRESHDKGELSYWYEYGGYEAVNVLARALYDATYNYNKAHNLISEWQARLFKGGQDDKRIR